MRIPDRLIVAFRKLALYPMPGAVLGMVLQLIGASPNLAGAVFLAVTCAVALSVENGLTPEFAQLKKEIETITVKPKDGSTT